MAFRDSQAILVLSLLHEALVSSGGLLPWPTLFPVVVQGPEVPVASKNWICLKT